MRTREGAPAGKLKAPTVQYRTTYQANTHRASAHRFTLGDLVGWAVVTLAVGAFLLGLCSLLWVVWP